jgi:hypothetical protein
VPGRDRHELPRSGLTSPLSVLYTRSGERAWDDRTPDRTEYELAALVNAPAITAGGMRR